ncbi:hypothetical protein [Mycolicibacterium vaccae]|uniref:Uncharacterized protein n=1 Tax=Mycolicibacterium vaccae ATCC 25954 TaxID=1194972 RepID=K0UQE8_MYCVA|nr:hypothetical protein [Mycolicibacterium vaccae]ANI40032.1 hypothetical protein MYVA_2877 [Mycolicibacterium vaccae 95051]EJZ09071.1 hypothetical protein MVAC_13566 [Mycolicibacterium vaccae ATCC 25954]MCV7063381.1 hypothetical protein [Mycolicibacterium vaccae]
MHVVLGLSLTSTSAAWALVDLRDGSILADDVVAVDGVDDVARAAARSVQSFALRADRDIDAVRLVWDGSDPSAGTAAIRVRTKLRLFGIDDIVTVTEDAALEGRNRTARHIDEDLVLAYGAARAAGATDNGAGLLDRIADSQRYQRIRTAVSAIPGGLAARAAAVALVAAVVGLVAYTLIDTPGPGHDVPDNTVAEAVLPAPPAAVPVAPIVIPPEPEVAPLPIVPDVPAAPQPESVWVPEIPEVPAVAEVSELAVAVDEPVVAEAPSTAVLGTNPAAPQPVSVIGVPHLSGAGPVAGPVPAAPPVTAPALPAPPAPAGPLGALFRALP